MSDQTAQQLLDKFDHFRRTPSGNVIVHTGLTADILELKEDYIQQLKRELENNIHIAISGLDELSATSKFVIMILQTAY